MFLCLYSNCLALLTWTFFWCHVGCPLISINVSFSPQFQGSKDESSFLKATNFFLSELATHDLAAAESCFPLGGRSAHFSPREVDQYNYSKGTIIVRLLEFATMILVKGDQEFWKVFVKDAQTCPDKKKMICSLFPFYIHSFWSKISFAKFFLSWLRWWCVSHPLLALTWPMWK